MKKSEAETYLYFMSYRIRLLLKGVKQMKTKMFMATVSIVLSIVFFSVPCFSQTIIGCYHNKNGKLRIVSDHSLCKKTELPITWNVAGPSDNASIYSANDEYLGQVVGINPSYNQVEIYISSLKKILELDCYDGTTNYYHGIHFTTDNCTGTPYIVPDPAFMAYNNLYIGVTKINATDTRFYYADNQTTQQTWLSFINPGPPYDCRTGIGTQNLSVAHQVTLPFTYPVAVPLKFE